MVPLGSDPNGTLFLVLEGTVLAVDGKVSVVGGLDAADDPGIDAE